MNPSSYSDTLETLATAFRALTSEERGNQLFHADRGTPVACGKLASVWGDGVHY